MTEQEEMMGELILSPYPRGLSTTPRKEEPDEEFAGLLDELRVRHWEAVRALERCMRLSTVTFCGDEHDAQDFAYEAWVAEIAKKRAARGIAEE